MKFSAVLLGLASVVTAAKSFHRPDSHWDFIVKGEETKRAVSNHPAYLADYQLRGKAVDPASLGVDNVTQYSGYLDDNTNNKHLFYWFFESRNDPTNDPVVLWLSGGPGCSSMTGLMFELGPATVDSQLQVHNNPNSWNTKANVLFLDQPVNTGYSYGDGVDTTLAASKDVYSLLALFFKQFPQYAKQDFHIAGESYAGHYIPEDASEILSHANSGINLKSIMIGNGLTDPKTQYAYYPPMACGKGGHPAVLGSSTCSSMQSAVATCQKAIQKCYDTGTTNDCNAPGRPCSNVDGPYYQRNNANPYDVTRACDPNTGGLCYSGMNYVEQYFNQDNVKNALGAEVQEFDNCNNQVNSDFHSTGDSFKPLHRPVPGILAKGVPVLIYAGDNDYICNWLGNQAWTNALDWPGNSAFNSAATQNLTSGGSAYGTIKSAQKLAFARIFNAGHLVPHDKPAAALDLIDRWIAGEWTK